MRMTDTMIAFCEFELHRLTGQHGCETPFSGLASQRTSGCLEQTEIKHSSHESIPNLIDIF